MSSCSALSKPTRKAIVQVNVQIAADVEQVPVLNDIADWVSRAVECAGCQSGADVSVRVVNKAEMQLLNGKFREQNKPTNVLSFPAGEIDGLPVDADVPLGDIVVCAAVVKDEAQTQGKALADHWAHMVVHGTLHLLGFDHESDGDAQEMEKLEIQILGKHGIANPYGESSQET